MGTVNEKIAVPLQACMIAQYSIAAAIRGGGYQSGVGMRRASRRIMKISGNLPGVGLLLEQMTAI